METVPGHIENGDRTMLDATAFNSFIKVTVYQQDICTTISFSIELFNELKTPSKYLVFIYILRKCPRQA